VRSGDTYRVSGQKVFISRTEHSDLMLLLVRTAARDSGPKTTDGLSVLLVDLRTAIGSGLTIKPLATMMNHATTELYFDDLEVPARNLIGVEGKGFGYILDSMNAERILIAAECIGDARAGSWRRRPPRGGAASLRKAHRPEPGNPVPHRARARANRSGGAHGAEGGGAFRRRRNAALKRTWRSCSRRKRPRAGDMCIKPGGYGFAGGTTSSASFGNPLQSPLFRRT
jgi:hypothetical protein